MTFVTNEASCSGCGGPAGSGCGCGGRTDNAGAVLPWFANPAMLSGLTANEATSNPLTRPTLNAADESPIGPGGVRKDGDADDVEAATRRRWNR